MFSPKIFLATNIFWPKNFLTQKNFMTQNCLAAMSSSRSDVVTQFVCSFICLSVPLFLQLHLCSIYSYPNIKDNKGSIWVIIFTTKVTLSLSSFFRLFVVHSLIFSCNEQLKKWLCHSVRLFVCPFVCPFVRLSVPYFYNCTFAAFPVILT